MPLDIYIYLKGGRGDGFVPNWNGDDPMTLEEGTLAAGETPADGLGLEVSEPYRDIFQATSTFRRTPLNLAGDGTMNSSPVVAGAHGTYYIEDPNLATWLTGHSNPITDGGVTGTAKVTHSDEVTHKSPRQYTKVCTWLVFKSVDGADEYPFKFRKADVIGWGSRARTE